jgi:2-polyprenyl-6-methoxyphenol hydroxylase-like FAD-dependent oxidoreductase
MSIQIAKQAVVVGAGMGGLAAAGALAPLFEEIIVLERDVLPPDGAQRSAIPQGRHVHVLLAGGEQAISDVLPGFSQDLLRVGAVPVRVDRDLRREFCGGRVFPRRDLGFDFYALSRPRLEATLRARVQALPNVTLESECRVRALVSGNGGRTVHGVTYDDAGGTARELRADLVVESSGRGNLTAALLEETGQPLAEASTIGVDMCYTTAVFDIPADAPTDWKGVFAYPDPPDSSRGALLMPLEGGRWIVSLGARLGEDAPGSVDGYMEYLRTLHSPTVYEAVSKAKRLGDIARYRFPESIRRHYARLASFPRGLIPTGDSICRFNPIYGQGMTAGAQEARVLRRLLTERAGEADPLDGLAPAFFAAVEDVVETPWQTAALPDLAYPGTRGERPADFQARLKRGAALHRIAAEDLEVHRVLLEVRHLMRPLSALDEPWLVERLNDAMGEA